MSVEIPPTTHSGSDPTPTTELPFLHDKTEKKDISSSTVISNQVVRLPPVDGGDPLVSSYVQRFRATCAVRTIQWRWLIYGVIASVIGGLVGNHLIGAPIVLTAERSELVQLIHGLLGNPLGVLVGMVTAAFLCSTVGVVTKRHDIPCGQEPWFGFLVAVAIYLPLFDPLIALGVIGGTLTLVYVAAIGFRLLALVLGGRRGAHSTQLDEPPGGWPMYTVLVPLYKERNVARNILRALEKLDYPHDRLDVKFLLEADDPETLQALMEAGIPSYAEAVVVPPAQPKTKPRACNHGLERARGEFLVIFDAEDRPEPDQLKQAVYAFRNVEEHVVCFQAQLAYHNHDQNLLTKWFALEYNVWFRRYLSGLVVLGVPIPLGGTSNHFRTQALRGIGGWDPFNVTEDCDLGVRLYMQGFHTRTLDSTTWEEANSQVGNWIRQRSRWLKGYMVTHLVWGRRPWLLVLRLGPWGTLGFILSVFCVSILSALNLALWAISGTYAALLALDMSRGYALLELLTTRDHLHDRWSWPMIFHGQYEDPTLAIMSQIFFAASIALILGNIAFVLITFLAGRRPGQKGLLLAALISPLYWILLAIAAWKGLWQLLWRPHYWEKTVHGLDKQHESNTP
jgi:cellulose synthase/poly-beta-1,6-N-acetylglucosamine synthase-like glycosyltransferase